MNNTEMTVAELWRFPIKSVGGEAVNSVDVGSLGLLGDRGWAIFTAGTNAGLTARREPQLLFATARHIDASRVAITLPDGSELSSDSASCDQRLSDWLERPVELRRAAETGGTYEVPLDWENDGGWVAWDGPGGAFHDSPRSRVSLVSRQTLGSWDARRFRTNIIVNAASAGVEDGLVGHALDCGEVRFDAIKQIDRCVMVTRAQPGLERDLSVLTTINAERNTYLAIGLTTQQAGKLQIGDIIRAVGADEVPRD